MPGLVQKALSSFTLRNFRRVIHLFFREHPRPRFKDIFLFLKLLFKDVREFTDDELKHISEMRAKILKAVTERLPGLFDASDRELVFRERRRLFQELSAKKILQIFS